MGQYRLPWLRHPFFLSESQYDSFQLYWALGGRSPPYAGDAQVASEQASEREVRAWGHACMHACMHEAQTSVHAHVDACTPWLQEGGACARCRARSSPHVH